MKDNISILIDATRAASRFLQRDYLELETLQTSAKDTLDFVEKAKSKVKENLLKSLSKYYKNIVFELEQISDLNFDNGPVILINPLGGLHNFSRSIPFFSIVIALLVKKNEQIFAEKVIINLPALGEIYYAEKGKGAWIEKNSTNTAGGSFRLRVSGKNKMEETITAYNYLEAEIAQKISSKTLNFGSCSYAVALLISGKVDCILVKNKHIISTGFELLIREAGGLSYVKNNIFIGTNFHLSEKIKSII